MDTDATAANGASKAGAPPHLSFRTMEGLLDRMERENLVPTQLDRTYLSTYAGSEQSRILVGLRWLGLIDPDNRVKPELAHLVASATRDQRLSDVLRARYSWALSLGDNATEQQLLDAFKDKTGAEGETRRKAVSFFLAAAANAGLQLSPLFRTSRGRPAGVGGTPRRATGRRSRRGSGTGATPAGEGSGQPTPPADEATMKGRYFDMLLKKAENLADAENTDLFDRLERLLGIANGSAPVRKPQRKGGEALSGGSDSAASGTEGSRRSGAGD